MNLVKVKCGECGKLYERSVGAANQAKKHGWRNICSRECMSAVHKIVATFKCRRCGKVVPTTPSKAKKRQYCSISCSAKEKQHSDVPWRARKCVVCGGLRKPGAASYCSGKCHQESRYKKYVEGWLAGKQSGSKKAWGHASGVSVSLYVMRWLRETRGNKCEECGWCRVHPTTGKVPLQAHHLDGDGANNRPDNLRLLCGACHSLTLNWGGANKKRKAAVNFKPRGAIKNNDA